MTPNELLLYAIKNKLLYKFKFIISILGIHKEPFDNEYISLSGGKCVMHTSDGDVPYTGYVQGQPLLSNNLDVYEIPKGVMKSAPGGYKNTLGRFFNNYILIEKPFQGKIPAFKGSALVKDILGVVTKEFSNDVVSVAEYKTFVTSCTYLEQFNKLVTPSSTEKLMLPPPDIDKYKATLRKEYASKHGDNWTKDPTIVADYDRKLKAHYVEYLKGDASEGVMATGKVLDNSGPKLYLTNGTDQSFGKNTHIDESLSDGYPKDPEKLVALFNSIRAASLSRGHETQKGGAVAKNVLRTTTSVTIESGDCGVKYGKQIPVTKENHNYLVGRYIIERGKLVVLSPENLESYIGKIVEMRSPMYCKTKQPDVCATCMGTIAGAHPDGAPLLVTNISAALTSTALKAMHDSGLKTIQIDFSTTVV